MNLTSQPQNASSLSLVGVSVSAEDMLIMFSQSFLSRWREWETDGFHGIRTAWLKYSVGMGGPVKFRIDSQVHAGTISGLDDDGSLILREGLRISAGDIVLPPANLGN